MENELITKPVNQMIDANTLRNIKNTENIPSLFEETNKILINFLKEIKKYDPNNTTIDILLKSDAIFSIDQYLKNYSFFCNEFFISEMEKPLKNINFTNFNAEMQKELEFCKSLNDKNLTDSENFKNKIGEEKQELNNLQEREKEFAKEIEKLNKQIEDKKPELSKANKEYEDRKRQILDKLNLIFSNKLGKIEQMLNESFKIKALEEHKDDLTYSFELFKGKFKEAREIFEKKSQLHKIELFDLDDLSGFVERLSLEADKEFKNKYERLIKFLDDEYRQHNEEKVKEILVQRIEEEKKKNLDQEKSIKELIEEENRLATELAELKNKLYHKTAILSQQPYSEKFKENVINLKNLVMVLMIFIMLALTVLL